MGNSYPQSGSRGLDVARIQTMLNAQGATPRLDPDGKFGWRTDTAVRKFQESNNLQVDGIVGPNTLAMLNPFRKVTATGVLANQAQSPSPKQNPNPNPTPTPTPTPTPSANVPKPQGGAATATGRGWIWQVQANGQGVWTPWTAGSATPSSSAAWSGAVSLAYIYRTKKDGFHIEAGPVLQVGINARSSSSDPLFTFSGQYQVTFADIFSPGSFHLLSPFVQGGAYINAPGSFGPTAAIGDQISYDIVDDRFSLFAQPSIIGSAASWNLTHGGLSVGPAVIGGVIIQW